MSRLSFNYVQFAKRHLDNSNQPILPQDMLRVSMDSGATHTGEALRKELRQACEILANQSEYKRSRVKGVSGYYYQKV
jgi:hypothetical protein